MKVGKGLTLVLFGILTPVIVVAAIAAGPGQEGPKKPRDVKVTGRVVDLHSYMTGKFLSSDKAKCTRDCILAGVPAVLETEDGLVLIGEGPKGAARTLAPLAFQNAEFKGKLYEKHGLRYIDITWASPAKTEPEPEPEIEEPSTSEQRDDDSSACCLPSGTCIETDEDNCFEMDGAFYAGSACDDVDCEQSEP